MSFPREDERRSHQPSVPTDERFASGLTVLIVDDEESVRIVLEELLSGLGFTVSVADSVPAARMILRTTAIDLLVSDKNLPGGTGLDLAAELAAREADTAVVLMTAYANLESVLEAIRLDVADFVLKPFESLGSLSARLKRVTDALLLKRRNRALVLELQEKNAALEGMIVRDPLTNLFNHGFLQESLEREVVRGRRNASGVVLLLVGIDRFTEINDRCGYPAGDVLMRTIAEILVDKGRATDIGFRVASGEVAARFGGDVLALVLPETDKAGGAVRAERIRAAVEVHSFADDGNGLPAATVSIGIAAYPVDGNTRPELLAAAEAALGVAKKSGRNRITVFGPDIAGGMDRAAAVERSIASLAFRFLYQPIVDARTGKIFAYEALCRPKEFASPLELIAAAELAGRMAELGRALRGLAVGPLGRLPDPALLFLNVHPLELNEALLDERESAVLPFANRIVLEVTENMALRKPEQLKKVLASLKAKGFRIALDDLGAGYASLNSLALLAPDFVKLDMEMLRGIGSDSRSARLIKHILEFTREEGMVVIAEGIETREERDVVRDLGCPLLQGYLFSRPEEAFCSVETHE